MCSEYQVTLHSSQETLFFSQHAGELCQWILTNIENHTQLMKKANVTIRAGNREVETALDIEPGLHEYRVYAPVLWLQSPPEPAASLSIEVDGHLISTQVSVGHHRPWTVYLLSDVCTDATWVYDSFEAMVKDDAELLEAELRFAEKTRNKPLPNRNHYNLVHARQIEYFLSIFPEKRDLLIRSFQQGVVQLNPFYTMMNTGAVSLEELIRHFYPARNFARQYGLDYSYANHQETPSITWGMATVLSGAGIRHLIKAILPYECPWVSRAQEPPLFIWEGPDGGQITLRKRNKDYVEGSFVLKGLAETNRVLHEEILPSYLALGDQYPFDAISLLGVYGDLIPEGGGRYWVEANPQLGDSPQSKDLVPVKVQTVIEYNSQGWEYPKLINASHSQFWEDIDRQISERDLKLEVRRGDYGHGWDAWPACLAAELAGWRQAQERALQADFLLAIASRFLDEEIIQGLRQDWGIGWDNVRYLSDHAWNGANDANRQLNLHLRQGWQQTANLKFASVIQQSLEGLASQIPNREQGLLAVFNHLGWERSGIVYLPDMVQPVQVFDLASDEPVPSQLVEDGDNRGLYFEARSLPPVGYRVFALRERADIAVTKQALWHIKGNRLEGETYLLEISPVTGGVVRLFDKTHGRELISPESPYHLNQWLYWSEGVEHTPTSASVRIGPVGDCFAQMIVETSLLQIRCKTTYTLYGGSDHVDICNEIEKEPSSEEQELDFVFPFNILNCEAVYEAPGALIRPGLDHLPGAGHNVYPLRHFVEIYNQDYGITFSPRDSFLIEFGHQTTFEDPLQPELSTGTLFVPVLENVIDSQECIRDQGGNQHFRFRFSLRGHRDGFKPVAAVRFGSESCSDLLSIPVQGSKTARLPGDAHSFICLRPDHVLLACLKLAEEDGLIARLWEFQGDPALVSLSLAGLGDLRSAHVTDLLEIDQEPLQVAANQVVVPVKARGISTVRLELG